MYDSDLDQKLTKVGFEKTVSRVATQVPVIKEVPGHSSPITNEVVKKYF